MRSANDDDGTDMSTVLDAYRPLDSDSVLDYLRNVSGSPPVAAEEIGDGNLNLVFRVHLSDGGSVIVKQAIPYLRAAGESWPLTLDRSRIEVEALTLQSTLAPGLTPAIRYRDDRMHVLVMEDLRHHAVWRTALVEGRHIDGAASDVGRFAAHTLLGSSDILMAAAERKSLIARFINPELCAITEDLVFTAPYTNAKSNALDEASAPIHEQLLVDDALRRRAAELRFAFMTRGEALLHGDLHTGSVMAAHHDTRVMDPEFAFYGPMSFDVGNLVANLVFSRTRHRHLGNTEFVAHVDQYESDFWAAFLETVHRLWPKVQPWEDRFLDNLIADTGRMAAMEMIRRLVGLAKVKDLESLPLESRALAKQDVLDAARDLALGSRARSHRELWDRATGREDRS